MDPLVSTAWLADALDEPDLVVLDASQQLPDSGRDARGEFAAGHIPGARFLDLGGFIDAQSAVPKALPTAAQFAARMETLGIAPESRVVLYDDAPIRSAARAWFIFTHYGHEAVATLDGGLAEWRAEGRPLETGESAAVTPSAYPVPSARNEVRSKAEMLANIAGGNEQVVDARDAARFAGAPGSGSDGHIPGARNLPFARLLNADGTYKSGADIRAEFAAAGVDIDAPLVTSCNSGVTAAVLLFGKALAGSPGGALYDGSWLEWSADPATHREQGPAA